MLNELMLPAEVKLLKPKPAGCWHWVPAMMHGSLVLCGPRVLPCMGPVRVSETARTSSVVAHIAIDATTVAHAICRFILFPLRDKLPRPLGCRIFLPSVNAPRGLVQIINTSRHCELFPPFWRSDRTDGG